MKFASSSKRAKRAKADARSSQPAKKAKNAGKAGKPKGNAPKSAGRPGGQPASMQNSRLKVAPPLEGTIAHARPTIGRQEQQAAAQLVRSGNFACGPEVVQFEDEFCRLFGLPEGHAVAVINGTTALHLALRAVDAHGKKVALPAYGYPTLRAAVALAGAEEIICDIGEDSVHLDLATATASGADIAILSHLFGLPADINGKADKLIIIEDCGDALGAKIGEKLVGLQGRIGCFSFGADEIITAGGQGGMVISADQSLIEKIRAYRDDLDFAMNDLQASIGRVQLAKLPNFFARREEIFGEYIASGFHLLNSAETPVRYRAIMRTNDAAELVERLAQGMIDARIPIAETDLLGDAAQYPHASDMSVSTISIPIYPHMSNAEVIEVAEQVAAILEELAD